MARNEVFQNADYLSLPVPAGTASGAPVLVGSMVGVTQTKEGEGGHPAGFASVVRRGAHKLTVAGAVAGYGVPIYITSANALTTTASTNVVFGYSLGTKGSGSGELTVALARI